MNQIRLKKDWPFYIEFRKPFDHEPLCITVPAGSVGEYFGHTDCYTFDSQRNHVPSIRRAVVREYGEAWFEAVVTEQANPPDPERTPGR